MIKILTGWSNKGGSTFAFMSLMNEFSKVGIESKLYGPHDWHLDKCNGDMIGNYTPKEEDVLIAHFLNLGNRPPVKKIILSCHEKDVFKVGNIRPFWDNIVFLNEKQRKYHKDFRGGYDHLKKV